MGVNWVWCFEDGEKIRPGGVVGEEEEDLVLSGSSSSFHRTHSSSRPSQAGTRHWRYCYLCCRSPCPLVVDFGGVEPSLHGMIMKRENKEVVRPGVSRW